MVRGRPPGFLRKIGRRLIPTVPFVRLLGYAAGHSRERGAGFYKFQLKPCELSYNSP